MTTSDSGNAILSRLAARNDGETTTVEALAQWMVSGECPPDVIRSAAWSILELITKSEGWAASGLVDVICTVHQPFGERPDTGGDLDADDGHYADALRPSREPRTQTRIKLNSVGDVVVVDYTGRLVSSSGPVSATDETFSIAIRIPDLLAFWNGLPVDDRPRDGFPLEILYVAWLNRPQLVTPNARATGRIIPAKLAHVAPGDRQAGKLFTTAAHVAHIAPESGAETGQLAFSGFQQPTAPRQQFILPGFKGSTAIGPCLPLALYDLGDAPATSRGPAAPLPLRLFVESVLAVPMDSRDAHTPVAMRITLRQMLDWLYPSRRKPRPNEYWPRLMTAFEALESPAARIPWYDPETGRGGSRRIVNISDIPRGPAKLDDLISIIVDLPPGSGNGPTGQRQSASVGNQVGCRVSGVAESGVPLVRAGANSLPGRERTEALLDPSQRSGAVSSVDRRRDHCAVLSHLGAQCSSQRPVGRAKGDPPTGTVRRVERGGRQRRNHEDYAA